MDPPKRIVGIKKGKSEQAGTEDTFGLIRRPGGLKSGLLTRFMSVDGIVPNAALAFVHFILILIIPFITPIVTFLALCEMTVF